MSTPNTTIQIMSVPFNHTQENVFSFNNLSEQTNYFASRVNKTYLQNTYVRDTSVKVGVDFKEVVGNYIRYDYQGKWYYGFINEVRYINDGNTEISFTIDAWQTYYFDIHFNKSFVEREHVTNDSVGVNLVSEPLNYAKYPHTSVELMGVAKWLYLAVTFSADMFSGQTSDEILAGIIDRVVRKSGDHATGGETMIYSITDNGLNALTEHINKLADKGANTISGMQEIPQNFFTRSETYTEHKGTSTDILAKNNGTTREVTASSVAQIFSAIGYTPRNKKLYTDQFLHWEVFNNAGSSLQTYPSDTGFATPKYLTRIRLSQNSVAVAYCDNQLHNKYADNIATSTLDSVNWVGNNFAEYTAQNKNKIEHNRMMNNIGMLSGASSAVLGNIDGLSAVGSGFANVMSTIASETDMQNSRTGTRGSQSNGSVGVIYANRLTSYGFALNKQDLMRADSFFDRYGYQVNTYKVPNLRTRTNFNYVKLSEANIVASIPSIYLNQIINMFNSGVTIWHSQPSVMSKMVTGNVKSNDVDFPNYLNFSGNEIIESEV